MKDKKIAFLILAGGNSKRMGQPKALLQYENKTFIQNIYKTCTELNVPTYVSLQDKDQLAYLDSIDIEEEHIIYDQIKGIGPISALQTIFSTYDFNNIFLLCVDSPKTTKEQIRYLYSYLNDSEDASSISTLNNKFEPCFSIYNKSSLQVINKHLEIEDYRLTSLINDLNKVEVDFTNTIFKDNFLNVNTIEEYKSIIPPYAFSISGFKNSYKTTLIQKLIPLFLKDKYKFSIVKHDGHTYNLAENTDTYKYYTSEAQEFIIYSDNELSTKYTHTKLAKFDLDNYLIENNHLDFIIIEGLKKEDYPKVLISSSAYEDKAYENITNVFLKLDKEEITDQNINYIYDQIQKENNARFF